MFFIMITAVVIVRPIVVKAMYKLFYEPNSKVENINPYEVKEED